MIAMPRILTAAGMVALLALFFACQDTSSSTGNTSPVAGVDAAGPSIVYVRVDSLQTGYTAVAEELERLEGNLGEAEANHNKRVQDLAAEVQRLQNQVQQGLLAPNRVQSEQQRIARREQEIMQQRDMSLQSIQSDQMRLQQQFTDALRGVLDDIQEERQYDYILNRGIGSPVLIGKDEYDITDEVLLRLNAIPRDSL